MLRMVYAVWRRGRREDKRVGKDERESVCVEWRKGVGGSGKWEVGYRGGKGEKSEWEGTTRKRNVRSNGCA